MLLRLILKGLLRPLFRIVFRVRVHGNANVKAERLLIVANHESFLDELLLGLPIAPRHEKCEAPNPRGPDDSASPFAALAKLRGTGSAEK